MLDLVGSDWFDGGIDSQAARSTQRVRLRNARLVSPLWHGDSCVGLSGLYAIINAVRLVLAGKCHLSSAEVHALLVAGLRFLDGRLSPQQCFASGLRVQLWCQLAAAMVEVATDRTRSRITVERLYPTQPSCRQAAFESLEAAIFKLRVPMMLRQGGRYTVVSGVTPLSLLLFDSGGACWVTKRLTGVPGDCEGARHVIYPSSFLALVA